MSLSDQQFPQLSSDKAFPREVHARACGKAIIVGEHAVVYGTHAVAMPLSSMHFQLVLSPLHTYEMKSKSPQIQLKLAGHEVSPRVHSVVLDAMRMLGLETFSVHAKSHSILPIGAGLGSSATLCVAVLRALSESAGLRLSKTQLAGLANELEKRFHGNPSGLDTAVVAFEECVLFAKHHPIQAIAVEAPARGKWEFALIDSHVRASTMAMIRIAEPYFKSSQGDQRLRSFDELSFQVHAALLKGEARDVAEAMNSCDRLLREAGVVPSSLQDMIEESRRCGAWAAKTTGAGGGGMILALLDPERAAEQTAALKLSFPEHPIFRVQLEERA